MLWTGYSPWSNKLEKHGHGVICHQVIIIPEVIIIERGWTRGSVRTNIEYVRKKQMETGGGNSDPVA